LGCQVSAAISGGFAPLIATALLAWENGTHSISLYMVCLSAITLVAVFAARETALREL
jgi:MHS family shikimate/dehydroshikimate transporter-like MFS transporter